MNLIKHIAEHLEFCGQGTVSTTEKAGDIFWGYMPDQPDHAVCVFSTDSGTPGSPTGARIEITVRAKSTKQAYEHSQAIADELDSFDGFLHGDGPDVKIEAMNTSQGLGADSKFRELYVSNFRVLYCDY